MWRVFSVSARSIVTLSLLLLGCGVASGQLVNVEVTRKVNVKNNVEISKTTIRMRNDGAESVDRFTFSTEPKSRSTVGDVFAATGLKVSSQSANLLSVTPGLVPNSYNVAFKNALEAGGEVTVSLLIDYLSSLTPVPAKIKTKENQYMRYEGDTYFYSPYPTEKTTTTIALPTATVLSSSNDFLEPFQLKPYQVILGPYENTKAYSTQPFHLRFKNNRGFLVASKVQLHYHVSHWGRVAVREEFELRNDAATLDGEWSRADYDRNSGNVDPTSHGDVWANMPGDATNIKYQDLIGNITTSKLRESDGKHRAIQLIFRFPLLGGWKNHFWYLYDILLSNHISSNEGSHELTLPSLPSLHYDLPIEQHVVRVLLPEGSSNIQVLPHRSLNFDVVEESSRTTLSYAGRPTLILSRKNVRSQAPHDRNIVIRYKFSSSKLFIAPSFIVTGLIGVFMVVLFVSRSNFVLVKDVEGEKRKVATLVQIDHLAEVYDTISVMYKQLQILYYEIRGGDGVDDLNTKRTELSKDIVKQEQVLVQIAERLRPINAELAGEVKQLIEKLAKKREYSFRFVSMENSYRVGDMNEGNYRKEMGSKRDAAKELAVEIANLFQKVSTAK